jgi:type II secretory pathway pseudopilin PulG
VWLRVPHSRAVSFRLSPPKHPGTAGITLVEVALVLSVAGMVLAVAIPTFIESLETSKAAEATGQLEYLLRQSASYYAVARPTETGKAAHCVPAPAGPHPAQPSPKPVPVDFGSADLAGKSTWQALSFQPREPLRYRYSLLVQGPSCVLEAVQPAPLLILRAEGDLDGDGSLSRFERRARLLGNGELKAEKLLRVYDRIE